MQLHNSLFVLKLMPSSAAPAIVMLTDGVVSPPEATSYDNLLMLLNREDAVCCVIYAGSQIVPHSPFAFIPDPGSHSAQRTAHSAQRTAHSAQRTAHSAQRTAHSAALTVSRHDEIHLS